ncbi:MAG: NAD-dependent epimerase/dehydratase family protein [Schleiferiaceae bacterium]|nr:NAD-dependent epimerase/dehydratase family protein [Schleiferiaceae bacterium]MDG1881145.1 NAD-dependent epimerase/dehydratase family protein [Schleiferiaceae bacterium]
MEKCLVIGAAGQIGTELVSALRSKRGIDNVIAADLRVDNLSSPFYELDVTNESALLDLVVSERVTEVYHLVAILSATGEKAPKTAWELNMKTLLNVLDLAKEGIIQRVFWPSSIAVFGPSTPREKAPQYTVMDPNTVYGISKSAGELWCQYYFENYGVDVRSIRYPGLISWKTMPGGGTTDYAIEIFHSARKGIDFCSFLAPDTRLPMMYMDDAVRATIEIMEAKQESIKIRTSYNLSGVDFTPRELFNEIKKIYPEFKITFKPDSRQKIADSWPGSIDDSEAKSDWDWKHRFDTKSIVKLMSENI